MSKPLKDKIIEIPDNVLKDLLTASEIRMLNNRWQIIQLLEEGFSIRRIAEKVEVGTDTVVRAARMIESRSSLGSDKRKKIKNSTSWVFGKSNEK